MNRREITEIEILHWGITDEGDWVGLERRGGLCDRHGQICLILLD